MKYFFAKLFTQLWQLGCGIPAGVEIAYHTTVLACDHLEALADGDDVEMPSPIQIDFENALSTAPLQQHSLLPWAWQPLCY